jgi:hypothetical protein
MEYRYETWYEYISAASVAYSGLSVTSGDQIEVTVTQTSSTGGITTFDNLSTGVTKSHTFTGQTDGTICGENAEWIVEDYTVSEGGSSGLVPFADFGTVTFSSASAIMGGSTEIPGTASVDTM